MDTLKMLEKRLEILNCSLNGMFAQQLERIHQVHQRQVATALDFVANWPGVNVRLIHMVSVYNLILLHDLDSLLQAERPPPEQIEQFSKELHRSLRPYCGNQQG